MTLITFEDGKVVFRDGAVGTEQACCCGESLSLPARCSCQLFQQCTTTVEYDGLVEVFTSSSSSSALYQKVAGTQRYDGEFGTGIGTSLLRELVYVGCSNHTSFDNALLTNANLTVCSYETTTVDHHFKIAFVSSYLTGAVGYDATFLTKIIAYTYDIGIPQGEDCPFLLEGGTVTIKKVGELDNGCNSDCADWLDGFKNEYILQPVTLNPDSSTYDELLWNPAVTPTTTAQANDDWVCSHELWSAPAEPVVSIACPP